MHRTFAAAALSFVFTFTVAAHAGNRLGGNRHGEPEIPLSLEDEFRVLDQDIKLQMDEAYDAIERYYSKKGVTSHRRKVALAITSAALLDIQQYIDDEKTARKYFDNARIVYNDIMQHSSHLDPVNKIEIDVDPNWLEGSRRTRAIFEGEAFSAPWRFALKEAQTYKIKTPSAKKIERFINEKQQAGDHPDQILQLAYRFVLNTMIASALELIESLDFDDFNEDVITKVQPAARIDPVLNALNPSHEDDFANNEEVVRFLPGVRLIGYKKTAPVCSFEEAKSYWPTLAPR